jgi:hypothetical protein
LIFVNGVARQRLTLLGAAALLTVALLAAMAGSPAASASAPAAVGGALSAPDVAQKKRLSACAKAKAALRKAKTKKAKAKAAARVRSACKKRKPKPTAVKNVSLALETNRAVSAPITVENGGSVTATATNGTKLTLTVPKDAVLADTTVTLTPVASIAGLPRGARLVGGAQFEPDGTTLTKAATLTLEGGGVGTAKNLHAVTWFGRGRYVSLWPGRREGTRFSLAVAHFSGAAVYDGPAGDIPSVPEASDAYYRQVVRPKLVEATTNDAVADAAIDLYLQWFYLNEVGLGDASNEVHAKQLAEARSLTEKVLRNAIEKAYERCKTEHKLQPEVNDMLRFGYLGELGIGEPTGIGLQEAVDKAEKCTRFELDFETTMTRTDAPLGSGWSEGKSVSHVRVLGLQLNLQFPFGDTSGEKQIEYLSWSYKLTVSAPGALCTFSEDGIELGKPFRVTSLSGVLLDPPSISLSVFPGEPTEWVKDTCTPGGVVGRLKHNRYTGIFDGLYAAQADSPDGLSSFRIDGWDFLGGSVYARKTYQRSKDFSVGGISWTENEQTTYVLRHTPQ